MGVGVGASVGGRVGVGERVIVGVEVGVDVSATSNVPSGALARKEKNTTVAATAITANKIPKAAGKLSVTTGNWLACMDFSAFFAALGSGRAPNSAPHTKQREAFSLNRVPQVGQIFVLLELVSILIRAKIIPSNNYGIFAKILRISRSKKSLLGIKSLLTFE